MNRYEELRGQTSAAIEQGGGNTEKLATEWAMPFIPDDGGNSPTDVPFRGGGPVPRRAVSGFVVFAGRLMMVFALVMLLGGVFAGFSMRGETVTRSLRPSVFPVTGVPTVQIENAIGDVRIIAGSADKVEVNASVDVRHVSRGLAEQALEGYSVDASEDPVTGNIVINARNDNPFDSDDGFADWMIQRSVNLTVTLPANSNLNVNVAAGRTVIDGISGRVNAEINAGGLDLRDVKLADGSTFKVNAGGLDFTGELLPDASIAIDVNAGATDFRLPRTTPAKLVATADAGSVSAVGWPSTLLRSQSSDSRMSLNGFLTGDETTKSVITVTVHAGSATIIGSSRFDPQPPPDPSTPPVLPAR